MPRNPSAPLGRGAAPGVLAAVLLLTLLAFLLAPPARSEPRPPSDPAFAETVRKTARMVHDDDARRLAARHGLSILDLTWEDTGRFKNSAVGPNISDMTIQVPVTGRDGATRLTCMPVIRFPNFSDRSCDIPPEKFFLWVGNETGRPLKMVSLRDYLGNTRRYLSDARSWKGDRTYLLADRDTHVLVSAQACFLPVPREGLAEFNPVLFNYQSSPGDPAVLSILATREGTSLTVIDNDRDRVGQGAAWGQQLYFNQKGQRSRFTGQRFSDFKEGGQGGQQQGPSTGGPSAAGSKGLNLVLLIQVPLKQKPKLRQPAWDTKGAGDTKGDTKGGIDTRRQERSDVELAVVGHGKSEGPFTEFDGLDVERDPAYPVRVTVQFYKATSNGVVDEKDLKEIAEEIDRVYAQADFVGSLVTEGRTQRPTEYDGPKVEPPSWWADFWRQYEERTGLSRGAAIEELRRTRGADWVPLTERELADEAEAIEVPRLRPARLLGRNTWLFVGGGIVLLAGVGVTLLLRRRTIRAA